MLENARYLKVQAGVRYWEDSTINGAEDINGDIPLRIGDCWCPTINIDTGQVLNWPDGVSASIHYKVCDDGEYFLLNSEMKSIAKYNNDYVPNDILCVNTNGYRDYIIFDIDRMGMIVDWKRPDLDPDMWV